MGDDFMKALAYGYVGGGIAAIAFMILYIIVSITR